MAGKAKWSYRDYNGELSTLSVPIAVVTSATRDSVVTLLAALRTAIGNVTLGQQVGEDYRAFDNSGGSIPNSSPLAQRQIQFQVQGHYGADNSDTFTFAFPIADLTLLSANSEYVDITAGEGLALATALNALDNSMTVDAIRYISRAR